MASTVTRDHHNLRRNLNLNGNYISNDGGDEGIKISDGGVITIVPSGLPNHEFNYNNYRFFDNTDRDDYFEIAMAADGNGKSFIKTNDESGNNTADLSFQIEGDISFAPGASNYFRIAPTTKTASTTFDATLDLAETLNLGSGAGGSDVHYGIRYRQTQTDLTGWDNVYLMFLDAIGSGNEFSVDDKAQAYIDINNTSTVASTSKGLHIDIDKTGLIGSGSLNTVLTGIDVDINTDSGSGHGSSTNSNIGLDIDMVGAGYGTSHVNTGVDINVSGATTNYALITSGGNVGIGVSDPDFSLEILSTSDQLKLSYDATNYFKVSTGANGATTLSTVDADGNSAQMVLDVNGSLVLDPYDGEVKFQKAGDLNDLCKLTVAADGATTIATADSDGEVGHLTLAPDGDCIIDRNTALTATATAKGLHIDYDHTGISASGQTITGIGLDLDMNCETVTHVGAVNQIGIDLNMVAAADGVQTNDGIDISCTGADANRGLSITIPDGGLDYHLKLMAADDITDYCTIATAAAGATTITTVDTTVGATANLTLDVDGNIILDAHTGIFNFYDAGDTDDAFQIRVIGGTGATNLQTMSDAADGHITIVADGHVEFDNCGVGFDKVTTTFSDNSLTSSGSTHDTDFDFRTGNKIECSVTSDFVNANLIFPNTSGNFLLLFIYDGDHDVTNWKAYESDLTAATNATVLWAGGTAPATTSTSVDIFSFFWDADRQACYGVASLAFATP